jgi:diaminopimelate epimerase
MKVPFTKMSGAGNDFVMIDNRDGKHRLSKEQIARLCDRHFGVGGDGVLMVEKSENGADFRMVYYNADGGEVNMCGNGARCFARFAQPFAKKDSLSFTTPAGLIKAQILDEEVKINLTDAQEVVLNQKLTLRNGAIEAHTINTGVPHVVIFVDDVVRAPVIEQGCEIRHHKLFPEGTNVNFARITGPQSMDVRTYERGVEDETLACGTGVAASAIIAHLTKKVQLPVAVKVKSGRVLQIDARIEGDKISQVTMQGPAEFIFSGEIDI